MNYRRFKTELGTYMKRVNKKQARLQYTLGYTVLIAAENPDAVIPYARYARLQGTQSMVERFAPREKYETREKRFNALVESFEQHMCGGDTKRYAFFYVPVYHIDSADMWIIGERFSDTRYMAGFKEWTLDGLKTEGVTV